MRGLKFVLLMVLLCGCQTEPLSQAKLNQGASLWDDMNIINGRKCQNEYGLSYGTPQFGECLRKLNEDQRRHSQAMAPLAQQFLNMGQWKTPQAFQNNTAPSGNYNSLTGTTVQQNGAITQQGAGFLVSQSTNGGVRYCYYNNLGKITSIQIATTQMCPQKN